MQVAQVKFESFEMKCSRWHMQVQLSEMRRELQELKASLRVAHKEKEHLCLEKKVTVVATVVEYLECTVYVLFVIS